MSASYEVRRRVLFPSSCNFVSLSSNYISRRFLLEHFGLMVANPLRGLAKLQVQGKEVKL
jgi:hypothetical protein